MNDIVIALGADTFICGCKTSNGNSIDEENFLVCPIHGQREYGWRTLLDKRESRVKERPTAME